MNILEANGAGQLVNFRVDKNTNFHWFFEHYVSTDGGITFSLDDLVYYEVIEFVINRPKVLKIIKSWSLDSGDLINISTGVIEINTLIDFETGVYDYYYLTKDGNGEIKKRFKGNFIVE